MAHSDKNLVITPNISNTADPKIVFSGANSTVGAQNITVAVYPTTNGTLSFEGSSGQLFSITNDLSNTLFTVADISGIPSIEAYANGQVNMATYGGNVSIGAASTTTNLTGSRVRFRSTSANLVTMTESGGRGILIFNEGGTPTYLYHNAGGAQTLTFSATSGGTDGTHFYQSGIRLATGNYGYTDINATGARLVVGNSTPNTVNFMVGDSGTVSFGNTSVNTTANGSNITLKGTLTANGGNGTAGQFLTSSATGNVYWSTISSFTSTVTLQTVTEVLNTKTGATGTVAHDYSTGSTWYHSSIAANFTANITNVPTTDNRSLVVNLILVQGATAYIPSALQVDGSALTIKWVNGVTPTGNPNKVDIATFTLIRTGAAWAQALGTYGSFG